MFIMFIMSLLLYMSDIFSQKGLGPKIINLLTDLVHLLINHDLVNYNSDFERIYRSVLPNATGVYWPCFSKSLPMFGLTNRGTEDWLGDDFFF